ncbi:MAG: class I SAM-dependent methyltransferase [Saprospiraceae bacterium]
MQKLNNCPACASNDLKSYMHVDTQMHSKNEKFNFDQCQSCQLVLLNPRVPLEDLHQYYTAYYLPYRGASAWGKYQSFVERDQINVDKRRNQVLQKIKKLSSTSVVLDIGCGKPTFLQTVYQKSKARCIGLDFSDNGWSEDKKYYSNLNLQIGKIKDLKLDNAPDFITMWHYLEHDYAPDKTLSALAKIAKSDTYIIIEVPNFDSESRRKYGDKWAGWHTPRHTFLYSPDNIKLLLNNNGWEVQDIKRSGTLSNYLLYWMSEMEIKGIDWRKNMESEFWDFAIRSLKFRLNHLLKPNTSHGIMLIIAKRNKSISIEI